MNHCICLNLNGLPLNKAETMNYEIVSNAQTADNGMAFIHEIYFSQITNQYTWHGQFQNDGGYPWYYQGYGLVWCRFVCLVGRLAFSDC